jgi:hypothetical protein
MNMPDMDANGPVSMEPAVVVWTLARELVEQQRLIAQLERKIADMQAKHLDDPEAVMSLAYVAKNLSDINTLRRLWYSKALPSLVAKFAVVLDAHETFGDGSMTIDDPMDAALWRTKYYVEVEDMTVTLPADDREWPG